MARELTGTVVSDVQDKTAVVRVERRTSHPIYLKSFTVSKKYQVHDEKNEAKVGDTVSFEQCAPISKNKSWKLKTIVKQGERK